MAKGVVSDYLIDLIAKQVEERSLVVWYDPNADYKAVAERLEQPGVRVVRYDGSFLRLRRDTDSLLDGSEPPELVVYVPLNQENTHHALVELEAAGVVMQPGQQPAKCNTRLALVARNALKSVIGEANAAEAEKQVEAGRLTLEDVDALGSKGEDITKGVVSLIFGTSNSQEVALAFLTCDDHDTDIEEREAVAELVGLLENAFGCKFPEGTGLPDIREQLSRHTLLTDLLDCLGDSVPNALASVKTAHTPAAVAACTELARSWRLRRDVRESYMVVSQRIEQDFSLSEFEFDAQKIVHVETFLAIERALLRSVEVSLLESASDDLLALARSRLSSFWAEAMPSVQAHWALIAAAAEVLLESDRVENSLKKPPKTIPALVKAYAQGRSPWCLLDSHDRHMESRWHNFDPGEAHESLEKLVRKAAQRYTQVGSQMAERFVRQFATAKHPLKDVRRQVDLFEKQIRPGLEKQKTAYVWVDALRFEMASELAEVLGDDFDLALEPAIAAIPTITEIGMAALLPMASLSPKVVSTGGGKLALEIDEAIIKDRKDRLSFVKEHAGVPVFDAKLDDLLPKPSKKVRDGIKGAQLVIVTSQEIDELCEQDNITQARRQMDGVLNDLRRGVRVLADLGVESIVLVADHGHLFGEEIGEDMKIEAPGGDTKDLHRRVWVGIGGNTEPSYLRCPLASLGIESEFDIATPWGLACFKCKGGSRAYFHGGLSPQELIIPVLTMTPKAAKAKASATGFDWKLRPGTEKLTTRFFSVQISGEMTGLFEIEPPKVRVELRSKKKPVSKPVSASYGFEEATGDVTLNLSESDRRKSEPNTVTVQVEDESLPKTVSLVLLDATTGLELATLDKIETAISL